MKKIISFAIIALISTVSIKAQLNQDSIAFHQSFIDQNTIVQEQTNSNLRSTATTNSGSFTIGGNENTYYPVVFIDHGWGSSEATIIELGRSNAHTDSNWNGSLIARFRLHVTRWGHGTSFIDADIKQAQPNNKYFIAGWQDASFGNNKLNIVIWLKGASTYVYRSNYTQTPLVTIGSVTVEGKTFSTKTKVEDYVNNYGVTLSGSIKSNGVSTPNTFAGKVGIGTNDPQSMLDVAGDFTSESVQVNSSLRIGRIGEIGNKNVPFNTQAHQYNLDFTGYRDVKPDQIGARISAYRINAFGNQSYIQRTGLTFSTNPSGLNSGTSDLVERMRITPEGTVGIGTNKPDLTYKLVVAGKIAAQEIKIDITAGADFVFESDYDLKPLSEVESFIKENKHLPEIPSEKQMQEEGLSVNEFQIKLLQKIEELTLYTIELKKEIDELKSQKNN